MLPVVVPLNFATACIPFFYTIGGLIYGHVQAEAFLLVYCCVTLSTSCNPTERNLMGSSWVTKRAKSLVHFFQSIFLQSAHLKILLPLWQNVEVLYHVIATFVLMVQEAHPLYTEVICFPENFYKTELLTFT
jgi:hypothetical protein